MQVIVNFIQHIYIFYQRYLEISINATSFVFGGVILKPKLDNVTRHQFVNVDDCYAPASPNTLVE